MRELARLGNEEGGKMRRMIVCTSTRGGEKETAVVGGVEGERKRREQVKLKELKGKLSCMRDNGEEKTCRG